jgi:hypothetical protein
MVFIFDEYERVNACCKLLEYSTCKDRCLLQNSTLSATMSGAQSSEVLVCMAPCSTLYSTLMHV